MSGTTGSRPSADADLTAALAAAQQGLEHGLSALFRAFHPRLLRYLRSLDATRADDIAGETWLAVARQIRAFEGDVGGFTAWLFTIARQRLADEHRTWFRRKTAPVSVVPDDREGQSSEGLGLDRVSAQRAVDSIVRHLTHDQADVVLLRTLGDLSNAQIAAILGHDETWVRVTHHRAMRRLQERVTEDDL